jgi:large subunit ribosomal protein L31
MADKEKKEPKEQKAQKDEQKKEQKQQKGPREGKPPKEAAQPAAQGPGTDIAAQKQALKEAKKKGKPVEAAPAAAGGAEQPKEKPKKGGAEKAASNLFVSAIKVISSRKEGVSRKTARKSIHPKYMPCRIVCGCGNVVMTRATVPEIQVGVCANCHPFYTGTQKFVDAAGRVEKFQQRYKWTADKAIQDGDAAAVKKVKKFRNK